MAELYWGVAAAMPVTAEKTAMVENFILLMFVGEW